MSENRTPPIDSTSSSTCPPSDGPSVPEPPQHLHVTNRPQDVGDSQQAGDPQHEEVHNEHPQARRRSRNAARPSTRGSSWTRFVERLKTDADEKNRNSGDGSLAGTSTSSTTSTDTPSTSSRKRHNSDRAYKSSRAAKSSRGRYQQMHSGSSKHDGILAANSTPTIDFNSGEGSSGSSLPLSDSDSPPRHPAGSSSSSSPDGSPVSTSSSSSSEASKRPRNPPRQPTFDDDIQTILPFRLTVNSAGRQWPLPSHPTLPSSAHQDYQQKITQLMGKIANHKSATSEQVKKVIEELLFFYQQAQLLTAVAFDQNLLDEYNRSLPGLHFLENNLILHLFQEEELIATVRAEAQRLRAAREQEPAE